MQNHAGQLSKSERLQRVYKLLKRSRPTTIQINAACNSTRASSDVSDLRRSLKGEVIICEYIGRSDAGRKVHRFTMGAK